MLLPCFAIIVSMAVWHGRCTLLLLRCVLSFSIVYIGCTLHVFPKKKAMFGTAVYIKPQQSFRQQSTAGIELLKVKG